MIFYVLAATANIKNNKSNNTNKLLYFFSTVIESESLFTFGKKYTCRFRCICWSSSLVVDMPLYCIIDKI